MTSESKSHAGLPSHDEARSILATARRMRAETLAGLARAVLRRLGHGRASDRPAFRMGRAGLVGALPHAGP